MPLSNLPSQSDMRYPPCRYEDNKGSYEDYGDMYYTPEMMKKGSAPTKKGCHIHFWLLLSSTVAYISIVLMIALR